VEGAPGDVVRMGLSHLPAEQIAAWVKDSCASQGVPVKVTDITVVRPLAVLLGAVADGSRAHPRSGSTRGADRGSVAPSHADPVRVQGPGSRGAGTDHGVVDQGSHDGDLAREVQTAPGLA
jgi:hypothetical protein